MSLLSKYPQLYFILVNTENTETARALLSPPRAFVSAAVRAARQDKEIEAAYRAGTLEYQRFIPNPEVVIPASHFTFVKPAQLLVEMDAEQLRRRRYPMYPSRWSSVFAYGDLKTCMRACEAHHWNPSQVREFVMVEDDLTRVVRANMNLITASIHLYKREGRPSPTDVEALYESYWSGSAEYPECLAGTLAEAAPGFRPPLWEYVIEGELRYSPGGVLS